MYTRKIQEGYARWGIFFRKVVSIRPLWCGYAAAGISLLIVAKRKRADQLENELLLVVNQELIEDIHQHFGISLIACGDGTNEMPKVGLVDGIGAIGI